MVDECHSGSAAEDSAWREIQVSEFLKATDRFANITEDNEAGKPELDNFIDPEADFP